jgi:hypothetical protein
MVDGSALLDRLRCSALNTHDSPGRRRRADREPEVKMRLIATPTLALVVTGLLLTTANAAVAGTVPAGPSAGCHRVHGHCAHSINYNASKSNTGNRRLKPGATSFGTARRHTHHEVLEYKDPEDSTVRPHR